MPDPVGGHAGVPVRCHVPPSPSRGALVWAHGGSWVSGSVDGWHVPCAALAAACQVTVLSVGYRLAPRWPYPAPLDDVVTVIRWAAERLPVECGTCRPLAVGGDSAGGTLAAAAAVRCRDEGLSLAAQVLAYPPLDPQCRQPSYAADPDAFPSRQAMLDAWHTYRGCPVADHEGQRYLTPWTIQALGGLPPAVLAVGELDPVADDVVQFAERLRSHGNSVVLRLFAGAGHGLFFDHDAGGSFPLQEWIAEALPLPPLPAGVLANGA